jgi:hypothetical protein
MNIDSSATAIVNPAGVCEIDYAFGLFWKLSFSCFDAALTCTFLGTLVGTETPLV